MSKLKPLLTLVVVGLMASLGLHALAADPPRMQHIKGDDLKALFEGHIAVSEYQYGTGKVDYRFEEYHDPDGSVTYIENGAEPVMGNWKIIGGDKICYTYKNDPVLKGPYCFFVYQDDKCYYNFQIGAMTVYGPRSKGLWTSRFIIKGNGGSCGPPIG